MNQQECFKPQGQQSSNIVSRNVQAETFVASTNQPLQISKIQILKLKQLEGECMITHFQLLKINYLKAIVFTVLMALSIIGVLLLKYYKSLRVALFYTSLEEDEHNNATHIYVKGTQQNESICKLSTVFAQKTLRRVFTFKHLRYEYMNNDCFPLGFRYIEQIRNYNAQLISRGLDAEQVLERESFYGKNQHLVEVPNYFEYLFDTMTKPFFIFQYVVSIVYILQNLAVFGILMFSLSVLTTSVNYCLLLRSYGRIKETAEKQYQVTVLRNKTFQKIHNVDLVCGDIYVPHGQIPCDSIIIAGQLFMDEASLTGEAVPIPKFKLDNISEVEQKRHWVYQGSIVKTKKQATLALAINTGFGSCRGRIIRKILTKSPKQPQFFVKMIYFLAEVLIISLTLTGSTIHKMAELDIQKIMILFRFLVIISFSFPAPLPIYFNLTYSFCLVRLSRDGIYGTESQKTIESARMTTICFDKTGTLTQNDMKVAKIFGVSSLREITDVTSTIKDYPLIRDVFGCCHSVEMINSNYEGDEIDLKMFNHVGAKIVKDKTQKVVRSIQIQDRMRQILKINQYQSKFQSMSVLYRHRESNKYFIASKGSPEMIHKYSQEKVKDYDKFIKKMSLQGFRSIAFGFRQIAERQVEAYLKADRQFFLKNANILGVVTFVNLLKEDTQQTIKVLTECQISTKIITGDNIFLGVQTALLSGMIPNNTKIIVVQGSKCLTDGAQITEIQKLQNGQIRQSQRTVPNFDYVSEPNTAYAIDNDYINSNPASFLHDKVKVFARISPQNKALIVRKHKEQIHSKIKQRYFWKKIFGEPSLKVGMVGDGANDLIAIKEADVGIGISSTDAVYSASFAVKDLSQIIDIICESKSTERQIVEMTQYFVMTNFMDIITFIILTTDASSPTSLHIIYKNFVTTIFITLFFALSRPAKQLSKYLPNSNFMGLEHHLVFWVSCCILIAGQLGAYFYYYNSPDFIANPQKSATFSSGFNGNCQSATVCFLVTVLIYSTLPIFVHRSSPWKQPIYKNIALIFLILINICLIIPIYFLTSQFSFLDLRPIKLNHVGIILAITGGSCLLCGIANYLIEKSKLHESIASKNQEEGNSSAQSNL